MGGRGAERWSRSELAGNIVFSAVVGLDREDSLSVQKLQAFVHVKQTCVVRNYSSVLHVKRDDPDRQRQDA